MMNVVIEATGVHKSFELDSDVPIRALRGLDLTIGDGDYVAVVGPSGCGKSTLINILAGLEPADSGEVEVAGLSMADADDDARTQHRRLNIGIVFQQYNLLEALSALDNVALAARIGGRKPAEAESRARDLLSLVALGSRADAALGSLSGGQRQRVAIARALANEPQVILADEPTGALDSAGAEEVAELFDRLYQNGQSIVLVTHDRGLARAAGRMLTMSDGRLT